MASPCRTVEQNNFRIAVTGECIACGQHKISMVRQCKISYQDVEQGSTDDCAIAAEPGVGDGRAEQRQQHGGTDPSVDGRSGSRRRLAERAGEVDHQVAHDAAEREALGDLHP
jgi:hypothetical protein